MKPHRILVVEDESVVALEIVSRLKQLKYDVIDTVDSGAEAIEKALDLQPDLILLDIMLQGNMDGIEAGRRILEELDVPIVFLTAHSDSTTIQRAQTIAPFGYLVKPFEPSELNTSVEIALLRHQMEQQVRQSEEWLHTTIRSIGDAVIATDVWGSVKFMNPAAEVLTEWTQDEAMGRSFKDICPIIHENTGEKVDDPVTQVLENGVIVHLISHTLLIAKHGREVPIQDSAAPIRDSRGHLAGVVVVLNDISERKKRENDLIRSQKLESLGVLAGGIAHDFNNLLTAIIGNISLAKLDLSNQSTAIEILEESEEALAQARKLTQQLLVFSKGGAPVRKNLDIKESIQTAMELALRGSRVKCSIKAEKIWTIDFDEGQFSQLIHNLATNSVQAMPDGGSIEVECKNRAPETDQTSRLGAPSVQIFFKDTGCGISRENLKKIFDPYFSTHSGASGLGLATVYSIIHNHDGDIVVHSEVGKGTEFVISIPASKTQKSKTGRVEVNIGTSGPGRILVMDDEEIIRKLTKRALTTFGYEVEVSSEGREAIKKYQLAQETGKPYDAVILDLTIPGGLGGKETMQELIKLNPEVKGIVSSGYSEDPVLSNYKEYGFCAILQKPYDVIDLDETIKRVILVS